MSKHPWCGGPNHHLRRLINCPGIIIIIIRDVLLDFTFIPAWRYRYREDCSSLSTAPWVGCQWLLPPDRPGLGEHCQGQYTCVFDLFWREITSGKLRFYEIVCVKVIFFLARNAWHRYNAWLISFVQCTTLVALEIAGFRQQCKFDSSWNRQLLFSPWMSAVWVVVPVIFNIPLKPDWLLLSQ